MPTIGYEVKQATSSQEVHIGSESKRESGRQKEDAQEVEGRDLGFFVCLRRCERRGLLR